MAYDDDNIFAKILRGVRQGCGGSPQSFMTFVNDLFARLLEEQLGVSVPGMPGKSIGAETHATRKLEFTLADWEDGVVEIFVGLLFADDAAAALDCCPATLRAIALLEDHTKL